MGESIESTSLSREADHLVIEKAVELSLIEIFIGSLLHNFHVPFAGHFLSLNQAYFYSSYQKDFDKRVKSAKFIIELSVIVSLMKSLSPSLKKLGPMMSISMQGLLYSLGLALFGLGLIGQIVASLLLSLWAFIQPLISLFLLYGFDLVPAYNYYEDLFSKYFAGSLSLIFFIFLFLKLALATLMPILARFYPPFNLLERSHGYLMNRKKKSVQKKGIFADLTKPFFLLSFVLMFLFFYLSSENQVVMFQKAARFISVSLIFFFLLRTLWVKRKLMRLLGKSSRGRELMRKSELAYQKILELS